MALTNGLEAFYRLSSNADDSSGNGRHGTPTLLTYSEGGAMFAAGSLVDIPALNLQVADVSYSISFMFKNTSISTQQCVLSDKTTPFSGVFVTQGATPAEDGVIFQRSGWGPTPSAIAGPCGTWRLAVWTYSTTSGYTWYVDGVLKTSGTGTELLANNLDIIGLSNGRQRIGLLKNIGCWSRELSGAEVTELQSLGGLPSTSLLTGLQRYHRLDSNGTEEVSAQHGVPTGSVTYSAGKRGMAANFNADNTRKITAPALNLVTDVSLSAWIYPTNLGLSNYRAIVGHGTSHTGLGCNYFLTLLGSTIYLHGTDGAQNPTYTILVNRWTHVIATRTAAGVATFYINGALISSSVAVVPQTSVPAGSLLIGCSPANTDAFPGLIDEVAIYNTILSQRQAVALFGEETPPDYTNFGDPLPELNTVLPSLGLYSQSFEGERPVFLPMDLSCHARGQRRVPTETFTTFDKPSGGSSRFNPGFN